MNTPLLLTGAARIRRAPLHVRLGRTLERSRRRYYRTPGAQNLSGQGAMQTIGEEAIVCSAYYDSVHVLSFGVGHTAAAGAPDPRDWVNRVATVGQVVGVFEVDDQRYAGGVRAAFTRPLSQAQFDAAFDFHFNTGEIELAQWVKLFNAGRDPEAETSFAANWEGQPVLKARRERERALFFHGTYSGSGFATEYPVNARQQIVWSAGKQVDLRPYFITGGRP